MHKQHTPNITLGAFRKCTDFACFTGVEALGDACFAGACFPSIKYGCVNHFTPSYLEGSYSPFSEYLKNGRKADDFTPLRVHAPTGPDGEFGLAALGIPFRFGHGTLRFGRGEGFAPMPDLPTLRFGDYEYKPKTKVKVTSGTSFTYVPRSAWLLLQKWFCDTTPCDATGALQNDARDSPGCWREPQVFDSIWIGPMEFRPRDYLFRSTDTTFCVGIFAGKVRILPFRILEELTPQQDFILGANTMSGNEWLFDGEIRAVS